MTGGVRSFVRVDGHLVRVSTRGQGPPILLIMGLGGNIEMWGPLKRSLNTHGFQTIAYDASGTGESPPRLVPQRMHGLARQAAHVLDALGHPDADVLGVSFGGAVAQELTLSNPHRVRRLVLASTMCGLGGVPGNPLALALLATRSRRSPGWRHHRTPAARSSPAWRSEPRPSQPDTTTPTPLDHRVSTQVVVTARHISVVGRWLVVVAACIGRWPVGFSSVSCR